MKFELRISGSIRIDDAVLERFRETDRVLAIALVKRDAAATTVEVTAEKDIDLEFDGDKISLSDTEVESRILTSEVSIRLPGVATVNFSPSHSVRLATSSVPAASMITSGRVSKRIS